MAFAPGVRRPAFWLLSLGLLAQLAADVVYTVASRQGTFTFRSSAALPFYVLGYTFVGAAALHPSMTTLSDPAGRHEDRGARWRLVALALAALTSSAVGILESSTGKTVNVAAISAISAVLFVLVLARVAGLMEEITRYHRVEKLRNEFVSLVSHELRTPLTSIRGALALVASGRLGSLPDDGQEMLDIAVRNTERLGRLLDDILDLERMDSGKLTMAKQPYSARGLAEQAVAAMRPMAEQASVRLMLAGPEATVLADPYRVVQALANLLGNAIKFSPPATTVWVTAQPRRGEVLFRVKDQGRGIPPDKLETIFGRFQQVDSSDARDKAVAASVWRSAAASSSSTAAESGSRAPWKRAARSRSPCRCWRQRPPISCSAAALASPSVPEPAVSTSQPAVISRLTWATSRMWSSSSTSRMRRAVTVASHLPILGSGRPACRLAAAGGRGGSQRRAMTTSAPSAAPVPRSLSNDEICWTTHTVVVPSRRIEESSGVA